MNTVSTTPGTDQPARPVTRPRDLLRVSPRDLLDSWFETLAFLVDARYGIGAPRTDTTLRGDALTHLAASHALAERVLAGRWASARDALALGATVDDVAAAMGLDVDEVTVGLGAWADGQRELRASFPRLGMSDDEHAAALALVADGGSRSA